MTYKDIVIFSLEGIESNTEVNFFEGLSFHVSKRKIRIFAMGKQADSKKAKKRIRVQILAIIHKLYDLDFNLVFFIGDGDQKSDIQPMERSRRTIIEELKLIWKNKDTKFEELIYEKYYSFDQILNQNGKIKNSNLIGKEKKHKKQTNAYLFNNIIDLFKMKNIDENKIYELMKKIFANTKYIVIFDRIFSKE